jgi:hypothetical protein
MDVPSKGETNEPVEDRTKLFRCVHRDFDLMSTLY